MRAVMVTGFGGTDVLEMREVPVPAPRAGEVTIDVTHAAVGLVDVFLRRGDYRHLAGLPQPPYVPGLEVAGIVREIGERVTGLEVGDRVVTMTLPHQGGLAEVVAAPAALGGAAVSPKQAAAGVGNAATAYLALTEAVHLRAGERVLVHGVTGALASTFPAVAKMLGASEIVGTVRRESKVDDALALGVDRVVLAHEFPRAVVDERFDVVVDSVGGELRRQSVPLLAWQGRLLVVGNASGVTDVTVDTNQIWQSTIGVIGYSIGTVFAADPARGVAAGKAVLPLIASGTLTLPVTLAPLDEAAAAFDRFEHGEVNGRLLLTP